MRLGVSPLRTLNLNLTAAALCIACAGGLFVPRAMAATGRSLVDASRDTRVDFERVGRSWSAPTRTPRAA
jgi:hypothetical protein